MMHYQQLDKISTFNPKPEYLQFIYTLLDVDRIRSQLKVEVCTLYSTSRGYLDTVYRTVVASRNLHAYRDVLFGGGMPEPKGNS